MEEIEKEIIMTKAQISYWKFRTTDTNPIKWDVIKNTVQTLEYVLCILQKVKERYEQNTT